MSRRCAITGKMPQVGHRVSHANNKTKRRFRPNLQVTSMMSDALGAPVRLRLSIHGIRVVEKNGGLDAYLLSVRDAELTSEAKRLKRRIEKAREKTAG